LFLFFFFLFWLCGFFSSLALCSFIESLLLVNNVDMLRLTTEEVVIKFIRRDKEDMRQI
jgi:hypothetical protein